MKTSMLKKDDRGTGDRRGISAWCHRGSAEEDDDRAGCDREGQYHEKRVRTQRLTFEADSHAP
jgi:hypothetical protein